MIIAVPADENEARMLLTTAFNHNGPAAVRYPRGGGINANVDLELKSVLVGKGRVSTLLIQTFSFKFWNVNCNIRRSCKRIRKLLC